MAKSIHRKNIILLVSSLLFYSWGEPDMVFLMIGSIIGNYFFGKAIWKSKNKKKALIWGIIFNLTIISFFKYTAFLVENLNVLFLAGGIPPLEIPKIRLPIGISFFTFQSISYLIDLYKKDAEFQEKISSTALYISLFPQLIAGPIVRYKDVAESIKNRKVSYDDIYAGSSRFIIGLSKKVLIANPMGYLADNIFGLEAANLSNPVCWLGAIAYSLQIYFDFSGYSDMAIGLGRIFGFNFPENFNFPYISKSIQEFWRRWHISLSTWFRDYLYIPLGGNRCSKPRNIVNLLIVFLLTGLWHGASWTFVVWGLFHGVFLIIEKGIWGKFLKKSPKFINHTYVFLVFIIGWVLFRSDNFNYSKDFIIQMFSIPSLAQVNFALKIINNQELTVMILGILLCIPLKIAGLKQIYNNLTLNIIFKLTLLLLSVLSLSADTYNPFIYFRF
jgi:alginate O-acetyltransferase complex protein AlgI